MGNDKGGSYAIPMIKTSVIVMTYRRLSNLEKILRAWLAQTPDVWLADSSSKFTTKLPIHHVRFSPDSGSKTWHAVALLTEGDFVVKTCDDILPLPGLLDDLINGWYLVKGEAVGIHGRIFLGPDYYKDTRPFESNRISAPQKVDFTGNVTLSSRQCLAFDLKGCLTPIEDLFWHMKAFPKIPKWVIPTKRYINLPEGNDKGALSLNKETKKTREEFYKEYYFKNYIKESLKSQTFNSRVEPPKASLQKRGIPTTGDKAVTDITGEMNRRRENRRIKKERK